MQRMWTAFACLIAVAGLVACSRNGPPNSLVEAAGYHVRDNKVYYLNAFPGKAFEIAGADAGTFETLDTTYGRDSSTVFVRGVPLAGADAASFELLDRVNFAKDSRHVFQLDRPISDDPSHFELLDGDLAKDSHVVYWSDGSVLSEDPSHFSVISDADHYLFTKDGTTVAVNGNPIAGADPATFQVLQGAYAHDGRRVFYFDQALDADPLSFRPLEGPYADDATHVYWMGRTIDGADPRTFRVLNADFECATDGVRAYYRQTPITGADPRTFPADGAATNCSETSISFAP